jgi:hypothetical protein
LGKSYSEISDEETIGHRVAVEHGHVPTPSEKRRGRKSASVDPSEEMTPEQEVEPTPKRSARRTPVTSRAASIVEVEVETPKKRGRLAKNTPKEEVVVPVEEAGPTPPVEETAPEPTLPVEDTPKETPLVESDDDAPEAVTLETGKQSALETTRRVKDTVTKHIFIYICSSE